MKLQDSTLTVAEFANFLSSSTRTARRIIAAGAIPTYRRSPRGAVLIRVSDAEAYLEAQRVVPAASSGLKLLVSRAVQRARDRRAG